MKITNKTNLLIRAIIMSCCSLVAFYAQVFAHEGNAKDSNSLWDSGRPDSHAPIGIMGDHKHLTGEFMLSFRTMYMSMDGAGDGDSKLSSSDVFSRGYMVAPQQMESWMHMVGMMFAPTDNLTLTLSTKYGNKRGVLHTRAGSPARKMRGQSFVQEESGWGDTKLSAIYHLAGKSQQRLLLNFGVSIPTGEFSDMAYPMHFSTGTWDLMPGMTYLWQTDNFSGGTQLRGTIHLDKNSRGFAYGDEAVLSNWLAYKLNNWASISARLTANWRDKISGTDTTLTKMPNGNYASPAMDADNSGGFWLDGAAGINLIAPKKMGVLSGHRIALEASLPIYQDINGPQLRRELMFTIGWQKSW